MNTPSQRKTFILFVVLIFLSSACGISNIGDSEENNNLSLASVEDVGSLPAAVVEVSPMPGSRLALNGGVTFHFNQSMDRASVEAALNGQPTLSGSFTWSDDRTVTFVPESLWLPNTEIKFIVSENAKAENGLSMQAAVSYLFRSVEYLEPIQLLPEPGVLAASPSASVVVSFNQPVISLGSDRSVQLPAFTLNPPVVGHGEWINTSTYMYTPELSLAGGVSYSVLLNQDLVSLAGAPLGAPSEEWVFTTDFPQVVSNSIDDYSIRLPMDISPRLSFNTSMNAGEVEDAFLLEGPGGQNVEGEFEWADDNTSVTFHPNTLLNRSSLYTLRIKNIFDESFYTFTDMSIVDRYPASLALGDPTSSFSITFSSELNNNIDYSKYISIDPEPDGLEILVQFDYLWNVRNKIQINGFFAPNTEYIVTVSGDLADKWEQELGEDQQMIFETGSYEPDFNKNFYYRGMWVDPTNPTMSANAINISTVNMLVGSLPFDKLLSYERSYWNDDGYRPADLRTWAHPLSLTSDIAEDIFIPLTPTGNSLEPGIYWLMASTPVQDNTYLSPSFFVASHVSMVFKISAQDVSVWAIDRRDQSPVSGKLVKIYDLEGHVITQGLTDSDGLFYSDTVSDTNKRYYQTIAMMAEPGEEYFSMASSEWAPYYSEFGSYYGYGDLTKSYVYTDRPIYRPGDTIHFRAILREEVDARYLLPDIDSVIIKINYDYSKVLEETEIHLSDFGSVVGSFKLPSDAPTGYYWIEVLQANCDISCSLGGVNVPVAAYVKPSVDLQVNISTENAMPGDELNANTSVEFYFGQEAGGMEIDYRWYSYVAYFNIPGYSVGSIDSNNSFYSYYGSYGSSYEEYEAGNTFVDSEGNLQLSLTVEAQDQPRQYYFSVNLNEEGEQMIGAEDTVFVHPAEYYIGIKPDSRVGTVDDEMSFGVKVVDWDLEPVGSKSMTARYYEVSWETVYSQYGPQRSNPVYSEIFTEAIQIDSNGVSQIVFIPTEPGVYMIEVDGGETLSQTMVWVTGLGTVSWRNNQNDLFDLEKDKDSYQPGETAEIFIPNSFAGPVQALISVERGKIITQEVINFEGNGTIYELYLDETSAPNVYLSVSIVGINDKGVLSLAQGRVNLPVDPNEYELNLEVIGDPERSGPGDEVTISLRVTDSNGNPVEGEFSVAVVDKAIFALADPSEQDILSAFYDQKSHGVKTSGSLLVSTESEGEGADNSAGIGGGGGDALPALRSDFKDTAYWTGQIVTDSKGEAVVTVMMPDNLTTWKILVRGITLDTKVGEAEIEILTTKVLIVRPVTPRFLVLGDHLEIGAFIHNNSKFDLQIGVAIQTVGFVLDDPNTALQEVIVPAGDRVWLTWWGTVEEVEVVKLTFAAHGGGLSDVTTPAMGDIPVLRYLANQTFATSGLMEEGGERLEVISLPTSVDTSQGSLEVSLATSLAGAILPGLEALEANPYESIEATVSKFLPNLEAYRAVQQFGLEVPELEANLARNLDDALFKLSASQNYDGGWAWTIGRESNPTLSAYALLGWTRAKQIGMTVNDEAFQSAAEYLLNYIVEHVSDKADSGEFDRAAFIFYVLQLSDEAEIANSTTLGIIRERLYDNRVRLNPWGQALFALALSESNSTDAYAQELYSNLKSEVIRSSTGAHWEENLPSYGNMSSTLVNTSVVLYALANEDPNSPLVADTVRYLMAHRDAYGAWTSNYATAWSTLALVEVMKGTGELGGEFTFSAMLNSLEIASGQAGGTSQFTTVVAKVGVEELFLDDPNALRIQRDPGTGRLYYSAALQVSQPVELIAPLSRDINIERLYSDPAADCSQQACESLHEGGLQEFIKVTLTLTAPNDLYYVVVEDYIPAGAEIVNASLKTYNYYYDIDVSYDAHDPYADGWGWWHFDNPNIYDDHIYWLTDYLPAGIYQLTYTIALMHSGEYQVIPAHAEQLYFPEIQTNSAGEKFIILP